VTPPAVPEAWLDRVRGLLATKPRVLLGLAGAPGSGKSTLAASLLASFADVAQVVPMDGYHLANVQLEHLGRTGRKGAPDTFDSAGYVALLRRLRTQAPDETVYAPDYRREIEEPVAGAIAVRPETRLVITEGNYLLLDDGPWREVRALLDDSWYVETGDTQRREQLARRHERFGRSREDALAWVENTDEPNARRIAASRPAARAVFRWD